MSKIASFPTRSCCISSPNSRFSFSNASGMLLALCPWHLALLHQGLASRIALIKAVGLCEMPSLERKSASRSSFTCRTLCSLALAWSRNIKTSILLVASDRAPGSSALAQLKLSFSKASQSCAGGIAIGTHDFSGQAPRGQPASL